MAPVELQNLLLQFFPNAEIVAKDLTGGGDHWQVEIVSELFKDKSMVEQHQMVYKALGDLMKSEIHALALNTRAK